MGEIGTKSTKYCKKSTKIKKGNCITIALFITICINYSFTLSTYSPVFAFTLINSPSLTNKGTLTVAPVSTVACFKVRVAVSPYAPGSV